MSDLPIVAWRWRMPGAKTMPNGLEWNYAEEDQDGDQFVFCGVEQRPLADHEAATTSLASAQQRIEALEPDALKYRALHTPEIVDFIAAVEREALFQREKWGADGDAGKTDADWFWLLGYLGGKAIRPDATAEKRLHHIITTAAACLNWHAARVGAYTDMRPGTRAPSKGFLKGESPQATWPWDVASKSSEP